MKPAFAPRRLLPSAALLACLAAATPAAFGQAFDVVRNFGAAPGEDGRWVGIAFVAGRAYQGSEEARNLLLPQLEYQWANGWFAGTSNGIGYNFSKDQAIDYGLRATLDFGRSESRSPALAGMGDVNLRGELGAFFNYSFSVAPNWRMGAGVSGTWANQAYMESYFGVTEAQSTTSGYAPYTPSAGLRDLRASLSATYLMSPRMVITAAVSYDMLQGSAKDSPLSLQPNVFSGVVALTYGF